MEKSDTKTEGLRCTPEEWNQVMTGQRCLRCGTEHIEIYPSSGKAMCLLSGCDWKINRHGFVPFNPPRPEDAKEGSLHGDDRREDVHLHYGLGKEIPAQRQGRATEAENNMTAETTKRGRVAPRRLVGRDWSPQGATFRDDGSRGGHVLHGSRREPTPDELLQRERPECCGLVLRCLIGEGLIPAGDVDERSITEVKPNDLTGYTQQHFFAGIGGWSLALNLAGWPASRPVRTGSCPCQPFSQAGKGKGEADERHLWPVFRDLISFGEPTITFGEQVASKAGREWLAGIRADLDGMGYEVGAADLCARERGRAPHQATPLLGGQPRWRARQRKRDTTRRGIRTTAGRSWNSRAGRRRERTMERGPRR